MLFALSTKGKDMQNKILFFINGALPTEEEKKKALSLKKHKVCFRNANFIDNSANIEKCDFVLGEIPDSYSEVAVYGEKIKELININKTEQNKSIWTPNS
jgi:hypothetical protein